MFLSEENPLAFERAAKWSVAGFSPQKRRGKFAWFRKPEVSFHTGKPSCRETSALITLCPICSSRRDNKSYKVTVARPQGHLNTKQCPSRAFVAGETPFPLSELSLPPETPVGVEPPCPGPFSVAMPLWLVTIPLLLIPSPGGLVPSTTARPAVPRKFIGQAEQGTQPAKNITW